MPAKEIMAKFRKGSLHSGSSNGPIVTNPHQARAIEISYARKEGADIPKPKKSRMAEAFRKARK
jgi:hypothetical protein